MEEINKRVALLAGVGMVLLMGGGLWWWNNKEPVEVEIIQENEQVTEGKIWVDVQGAVENPGAYELGGNARVKDALLAAGGLDENADRSYVARYINTAQKVSDGIKIYIPRSGEGGVVPSSQGNVLGASGMVSINSASQSLLEGLTGIGAVRAKAIIEGRPYGSTEELKTKNIIPSSVFEKIKEKISI